MKCRNKDYHFIGESFKEVYEQLLNKLNAVPLLDNVTIEINSKYEEFNESLNKYLKDDYLQIGDRKYGKSCWLTE